MVLEEVCLTTNKVNVLRCVPINEHSELPQFNVINSMLSTCSFVAGRGINSSLLTIEFLVLKIGATISFFPSTEKTSYTKDCFLV